MHSEGAAMVTENTIKRLFYETLWQKNQAKYDISNSTSFAKNTKYFDEKATQFVRKTYEISIFLVSLCALLD